MNERDLFMNALQISDAAERAAYLDGVTAGQTALRQRVDALLAAFNRSGSFLQRPAGVAMETSEASLPELPDGVDEVIGSGSIIGLYKLIEQIGEGGFSVVYMAEQTQPVRRKVAFKILKRGMDTRPVVARFEAERQALALMDHPNIAKVLDAGATSSGRPYFVMELVKGVPITEFCDQNQLTLRQRLELFVSACFAVQHAHQKGIIHRDLKPSNVLVARYDDRPVPKVIDFGIAKAIDQQLTEHTLHTGFWAVVGTLEYMSPEQASFNQLDIDTRSDIYSLGILLYELLTGTTPLIHKRVKEAGMLEALRIIREEEAATLRDCLSATAELASIASRRGLQPSKLTKQVQGELNWIAMKALEKDRDRRYSTATALAADVERYLSDEPVQACPPSAAYRFRKFARRNKGTLAAAGLVAVVLIASIVVSAWYAVLARRAESGAKQETATAEAVNEFLNEDLLAQASPSRTPDRDLKLRAVLDRASQRIEGRFDDQPLVEARLRGTLAMTYESLGEYQVAERHARRARELYEAARGPEHPDTLAAMNRLARVLTEQQRYDESRRLFEEVLALRRRVLAAEHPDTLTSQSNLANVLREQNQLEEARKLHDETLNIRRRVLGPQHPDTLESMSNLAVVLLQQERLQEARDLMEEVLPLRRRVLGDEHPDTLGSMHTLAHVLVRQGHVEEANKLYEEALEIQRRVLGATHSDTLASTNNLAWLLATAPDAKFRAPARAVELATELAQLKPEDGNSWNTLGTALYRAGDWQKAIAALEKSVTLNKDDSPYNSFFLAMAHWQLSKAEKTTAEEQARHRRIARKHYDDAAAWMEKNRPKNEELIRFRTEAAELVGVQEPPPKAPK